MAGYEPEEPELSDDSKYCQAVRIGRDNKGAELTIFYTPNEGQARLLSGFFKLMAQISSIKCVKYILRIPNSQRIPGRGEGIQQSW